MSSLWARLMGVQSKEQLGWMKDNASESCLICSITFSIRIRRHHCRVCYRLVCGNCSPHQERLDANEETLHRVCNQCYTQLHATSLSSVRQVRSALRIENTEQILIRMTVHAAENLKAATEGGFLTNTSSDSVRHAYLTISLNGKIMGTTSVVNSLNPVWNEFFQFKWAKSGSEMQFLGIEVWDKGRRVGGDELVCRCRIPLLRSKETKDGEEVHHLLYDIKDGRTSHSRVRITLQKGILPKDSTNSTISPPPPRPPQHHPMTTVIIPYSVKFQYITSIKRGLVEIPLTQVFPPQSPMFTRLFLPLKKARYLQRKDNMNHLPSTQSYDEMTKESYLHMKVLPSNEYLLEAIGKVWLRLPGAAGGAISSALGTQNSAGGTVIISSGGIRSTYWLGVLLVTSHRVIFISYPRTSKKHKGGMNHNNNNNNNNHNHSHDNSHHGTAHSSSSSSSSKNNGINNSSRDNNFNTSSTSWVNTGKVTKSTIGNNGVDNCKDNRHSGANTSQVNNSNNNNNNNNNNGNNNNHQNDERLNWLPHQIPGPCFPLCISMTDVHTCTIKKHWRDRFTALEMITKDSIGYIFAVERPSERVGGVGPSATDNLAEMAAINTMRRIKEEITWRTDEDVFYYRHDIMHTKVPMNNKVERSPSIQVAAVSSSSYQVEHHIDGYDMNESIVNKKYHSKDEPMMKAVRASSPINHGFNGPLFASSPSKNPLTPSLLSSSSTLLHSTATSAPNSPERGNRDTHTNTNNDNNNNNNNNSTVLTGDEEGKILTMKGGDSSMNEELLVDKTPLPYPRTIASDLIDSEFSLSDDFRRQRVSSFNAWRMTTLNNDYSLCSTYPPTLCVPRYIKDDAIKLAASYRSSNRLPVLTWIHPLTGASLCRSSQPLAGITSAHCAEDEQLLMSMRDAAIDTQIQLKEEQNIAKGIVELVMNEQKMMLKASELSDEKDLLDMSFGIHHNHREEKEGGEGVGTVDIDNVDNSRIDVNDDDDDKDEMALLAALYSDSDSDQEVVHGQTADSSDDDSQEFDDDDNDNDGNQ